jgi:hypothetical protein
MAVAMNCPRIPDPGRENHPIAAPAQCEGFIPADSLHPRGTVPSSARRRHTLRSDSAIETARTSASAIASAASAPTIVTLTSPCQRPVASAKTVSPSPGMRRVDRAREPVVGHQRHAVDLRLRQARVGGHEADGGVLARARRRTAADLAGAQQRSDIREPLPSSVAHARDDLARRRDR